MHTLRPFQSQALRALEAKPAHVLCIAPTGSGKSLIFERRIATGRHKTLLVTPLVALARQQRQRVQCQAGKDAQVRLGSGSPSEGPPPGRTGTWIVSPETLVASPRKHALNTWRPDFLVVDECHCFWDWGESFRPAFAEVPHLIARLGIERSLWLTATLPNAAREELRRVLPPLVEIGEFDLPESLHLEVRKSPWVERISTLIQWVTARQGSGVVFTGTRETTERLCRLFQAVGRSAVAYHAGLSQEERRAIEAMISRGAPQIVIATSAFGMGMDHKHLNWVALLQPPGSLLALTQAIGRAGRGEAATAHALILWDNDDFRLLEWTLQGSERRKAELLLLREFLVGKDCRRTALRQHFGAKPLSDPECERCDICRSRALDS